MVVRYHDSSDPLAIFTMPPSNETPEEKAVREEREAEAQRISDQIDNELRIERAALQEQKNIVKILLLGQPERKSTTLKYFQMRYAPNNWLQERPFWRTVVQLNLVHAVNTILGALQDAFDDDDEEDPLPFTDKHHFLRLRLRPLHGVESDLKQLVEHSPQASHNWRSFLQARCINNSERFCRPIKHDGVNAPDVNEVITSCKNDIMALWADSLIRKMLQRYMVRLEDSASFFLDNAERLATRDYEPTNDDVVRARLRTLGIQEHMINVVEDGVSQTWKIYDVGGSRTQILAHTHRNTWLPYFDRAHAIIFLAPVSCFDERLHEDPTVNRLEDSFILWKAVCSSKLLSRTALILFLNKVDILEKKNREWCHGEPVYTLIRESS
ncbi:G-alpha-domain-containing protein [Imleria badia]|nr:G-alpha-domain-containing protein [Imleria badia]